MKRLPPADRWVPPILAAVFVVEFLRGARGPAECVMAAAGVAACALIFFGAGRKRPE